MGGPPVLKAEVRKLTNPVQRQRLAVLIRRERTLYRLQHFLNR
jgi:hypothetical protein